MAHLIDLSHRGKLIVSGRGARPFLENVATNDLPQREHTVSTAFVDRFAKIIALCSVRETERGFLLDTDLAATLPLLRYLQPLAPLSQAVVENVTFAYGLLHLSSKDDEEFLKDLSEDIMHFQNGRFGQGTDLFVPAAHVTSVANTLRASVPFLSPDEAEAFRIVHGIPVHGADYDSSYMLLEASDSCVSYTKGCFIGQEVLARMKNYAGQLPRKVVAIRSASPIMKGETIQHDNQEVGKVTSVCTHNDVWHGIATIKKPWYAPGERIMSQQGNADIYVQGEKTEKGE